MTIRAKMRCKRNEGGIIELEPVTSGSKENEEFYKLTPGGFLTLQTVNEKAAIEFLIGREYYVDLSLAPMEETR